MVFPAKAGSHRRRPIPQTRTPKKSPQRKAAPARKKTPSKAKPLRVVRSGRKRSAPAGRARPARPTANILDMPLGVGVADAFAVERLRGGPPGPRDEAAGGVREIGWAEFGALARDLAARIAGEWRPDVVLAIANAGVFVGGAMAPLFDAELVHLHLPGRGPPERLPRFDGKKVLVVDDAANSGKTLDIAVKAARNARAAEVRSAVLALRPGGARPDWCALETRDVVVFGWDYQIHSGGGDGDPGDMGV